MSKTIWYCVSCGAERPPDPQNRCPREGCNMRAYSNVPPENPVIPTIKSEKERDDL